MKGKLDIAEMEAAFKRAADKAVHGTREERSGRFLPRASRGASYGTSGNDRMRKHELYVERRQQGDYAVRREGFERASVTAPTQKKAIEKAEKLDPKAAILVERVRDTNVGGRDKWRKA